MRQKFLQRNHDIAKHHDRLEITTVIGASIGALAFGAAGVAAFTELIPDQPEQYLVAGSLGAIAVTGLAMATHASMKLPILKAMLKVDAQPETQLSPSRPN